MDFVSTALISLPQPKGVWESILNAFKGSVGSYIWAVILVAIIIRFLFVVLDVINKKTSMKNNVIMAKMKPELDAIQKKYGYDTRLMQQKQSEIYKKYQFGMMGACLPMLINLVLQFVVFLTLWNALRSVSEYNIVNKYEDMKNIYANVIALNENGDITSSYTDGDELSIEIVGNKLHVVINGGPHDILLENITKDEESNSRIYDKIHKYVDKGTTEAPNADYVGTELSEKLVDWAVKLATQNYEENQESFMWIKNIYKAESPTSPLFNEKEIKNYLSKYYTKTEKATEKANDYEGKIFKFVITNGVGKKDFGKNGYYILTIIAMVVSFLSLWLSNFMMKGQAGQQKQSKIMYFIMPLIMGIFTFMYTSLFAVYIIVGQLMMLVLTPLTTIIVKKWNEHDMKKKQDKDVVVVDYRRKNIEEK